MLWVDTPLPDTSTPWVLVCDPSRCHLVWLHACNWRCFARFTSIQHGELQRVSVRLYRHRYTAHIVADLAVVPADLEFIHTVPHRTTHDDYVGACVLDFDLHVEATPSAHVRHQQSTLAGEGATDQRSTTLKLRAD